MEGLLEFVRLHGYWMLFAVGFAEFSGFPIVSVPVIVAVGGLSVQGGFSMPLAVAATAAGGLLADAGWFALGRWQGHRIVGVACTLTSNPRSCVLGVEDRVCRFGATFILPAKFMPGVGNLLAPAAGFAGVRVRTFLLADGAALLIWAGVYAGLGRILSGEVRRVLELMVAYRRWVLGGAVLLVAGAAIWRWIRGRRHREGHRRELESREEAGAGAESASPVPDREEDTDNVEP